MTPSASPYAIFNAEEWFPAVPQPVCIDDRLQLTPKKLTTVKTYVRNNAKLFNKSRKGFSKKHVQLAFA
tara:strand:+ start:417 stop:623 length:207 start_codon:yes stop_codon:yes gene_type:complete